MTCSWRPRQAGEHRVIDQCRFIRGSISDCDQTMCQILSHWRAPKMQPAYHIESKPDHARAGIAGKRRGIVRKGPMANVAGNGTGPKRDRARTQVLVPVIVLKQLPEPICNFIRNRTLMRVGHRGKIRFRRIPDDGDAHWPVRQPAYLDLAASASPPRSAEHTSALQSH